MWCVFSIFSVHVFVCLFLRGVVASESIHDLSVLLVLNEYFVPVIFAIYSKTN